MKYVILTLLFCLCCGIGWMMSTKYTKRKKFFNSLIVLADKLSLEINFSRERLKVLLQNIDESEKRNLLSIDQQFVCYLDKDCELTQEEMFKKAKILTNEEKNSIFMFLKALGRSDVENQTKEIQSFVARFSEKKKQCDDEAKKYGGLCLKLGIIVGLFVVVLFI